MTTKSSTDLVTTEIELPTQALIKKEYHSVYKMSNMENISKYWPVREKEYPFKKFRLNESQKNPKQNKFSKILGDILWKWNYLKCLPDVVGESFELRDYLLDFVSRKEKTRHFELWSKYPKVAAMKRFGLIFPDGTPPEPLKEVMVEGMYFGFPDFIPNPNETIVDIGAQFGDYAILCSKLLSVKKIIAFEPLPDVYTLFKEATELNSVKNIEINNLAVGSFNGSLKMFRSPDMASISGDIPFSTTCVTLDSQINEKIDSLKIDVEGLEMEVLRGAHKVIEKYHPRIIIETHSLKLKMEVISFLSQFGYSVKHLGRSTFSKNVGMDFVQNLYLM